MKKIYAILVGAVIGLVLLRVIGYVSPYISPYLDGAGVFLSIIFLIAPIILGGLSGSFLAEDKDLKSGAITGSVVGVLEVFGLILLYLILPVSGAPLGWGAFILIILLPAIIIAMALFGVVGGCLGAVLYKHTSKKP